MCLSIPKKMPKRLPKYAYKIFDKSYNVINDKVEYFFPYQDSEPAGEGKWIKSVNTLRKLQYMHTVGSYKIGFHAFVSLQSALINLDEFTTHGIVKKVMIDDIVAYGKQYDSDIIVFRKMYLMNGEYGD